MINVETSTSNTSKRQKSLCAFLPFPGIQLSMLSLLLSLKHKHTYAHALKHTHTLSCPLSRSQSFLLQRKHTFSHSDSYYFSRKHSHTHTFTFSHFYFLSPSLSVQKKSRRKIGKCATNEEELFLLIAGQQKRNIKLKLPNIFHPLYFCHKKCLPFARCSRVRK